MAVPARHLTIKTLAERWAMSFQRSSERKRLLALVLIMACVVVITVGTAIWVLYQLVGLDVRILIYGG